MFSILMFAQNKMFYFDIIIDFGFKLSATREIAVNVNSKTKINPSASFVHNNSLED